MVLLCTHSASVLLRFSTSRSLASHLLGNLHLGGDGAGVLGVLDRVDDFVAKGAGNVLESL